MLVSMVKKLIQVIEKYFWGQNYFWTRKNNFDTNGDYFFDWLTSVFYYDSSFFRW